MRYLPLNMFLNKMPLFQKWANADTSYFGLFCIPIQFFSSLLIIGHQTFHESPERGSMVFDLKVTKFMENNIVDTFRRSRDKP